MRNFPSELKNGMGEIMRLDTSRLLLSFKKEHSRKEIEDILHSFGFVLEDTGDKKEERSRSPIKQINHTAQRFWIRSQRGNPVNEEVFASIQKAFRDKIDWIGPVYHLPQTEGREGMLCPIPNVLIIKPRRSVKGEAASILSGKLGEFGLKEVEEKSKYLNDFRYFVISDTNKQTAYQLQTIILEKAKDLVSEARFENMPMLVPTSVIPNDPLFPQQWDMTQIGAGGAGTTGWDISTGTGSTVVCVLDTGCDLTHPDLQFSTPGINLGTMMPDGSPTGNHGTACAGIVAARFNNLLGTAGMAGNCQIMPVAFQNWSDTEVAAGINYAADNGALIISMSFGYDGWDHSIIDPAIQHAFDSNVVMCVATHNYDSAITYPATNPLVIACGASDQIDNRKSPSSPDGEYWWGSNFGAQISVVAPGVMIPTTDRQGSDGYNTSSGTAGNYHLMFNGTSSATPHVAGLAALIRSQYPTLTNVQVRNIIERTADKVGVVAYADTPGYNNGTWNEEMGYGRINVFKALDFADVMIKDWSGDSGIEPSTPPSGVFWEFSDIVVRIFDDNVFVPDDPSKSRNVERGQTNYLYIRVTNNGAREARNVVVNARITPYVGLQFVYPADWTNIDGNHVSPTPVTATFPTIAPGTSQIAKFTISAAQVESLWGWTHDHSWHPCMLTSVTADNDYAFASASLTGNKLIVRRNNLAQRNLSVIDVIGSASASFPFIAGNLHNIERFMDIVVDRSKLPQDMKLLLSLDEDGSAFPLVDFNSSANESNECSKNGLLFLERTKIKVIQGCFNGILTLEKGSSFTCSPCVKIGKVSVKGGEVIVRDNQRFVDIKEKITVIRMEKQPGQLYPLALTTNIPEKTTKGQAFAIRVAQRNEKEELVGGASVIFVAK